MRISKLFCLLILLIPAAVQHAFDLLELTFNFQQKRPPSQ
jgi:hypothetical protein